MVYNRYSQPWECNWMGYFFKYIKERSSVHELTMGEGIVRSSQGQVPPAMEQAACVKWTREEAQCMI
jgi:hypothetical protein